MPNQVPSDKCQRHRGRAHGLGINGSTDGCMFGEEERGGLVPGFVDRNVFCSELVERLRRHTWSCRGRNIPTLAKLKVQMRNV